MEADGVAWAEAIEDEIVVISVQYSDEIFAEHFGYVVQFFEVERRG